MDEFELIRRNFANLTPPRADVTLGIGDDAALLQLLPGHELVVSTDTLVVDHHFFYDASAYDIGWKALAASLSDLAAMGATPQWVTLALTLPEADATWLREFARGLKELAEQFEVALVGGDTTHGPLSVTVTAFGAVQAGGAIRRSGAKPGDLICVTGTLGDAALALRMVQLQRQAARSSGSSMAKLFRRKTDAETRMESGFALAREPTELESMQLRERLDRPQPRVAAGLLLRDHAHAMIDLSDGLAGDLAHILGASKVGADIWMDRLPASSAFAKLAPPSYRFQLQMSGGDDYELCICLSAEAAGQVRHKLGLPLTIVGHITDKPGVRYMGEKGVIVPLKFKGFRHFE